MTLRLVEVAQIRSGFTDVAHTPIQSALSAEQTARVEVRAEYARALIGLEGFDYLWLITWLGDGNEEPAMTQVPFLMQAQRREVGMFAMRGPHRINPVGLSLVRVISISGTTITFAGVDMVDCTPVIDIKPYVSSFDSPPNEPRCGWYDNVELPAQATPSTLRARLNLPD